MNTKKLRDDHEGDKIELARILEEKEHLRQQSIAINKKDSIPVLIDLQQAGLKVEWISDLYHEKYNYKHAIPILLKWLPRIDNVDVKEAIVRSLTVPWSKPAAIPVLLDEFKKIEDDNNLKWAIGNALSVVAEDSVFEEIVALVQDPRHGSSRVMLALSLANMKDPHAEDILIGLLGDNLVAGQSIVALGKLKSQKAYPYIEPFTANPDTWLRNTAKKALEKIEKATKKSSHRDSS